MLSTHRRYAEWNPERSQRQASAIGPNTEALVLSIVRKRPYPEEGFRTCLGFCGFTASRSTPERIVFVRFHAERGNRELDRTLFDGVTRQLKNRVVVAHTGAPADASLIPSASIQHGGQARWAGHRGCEAGAWLQGA